MRAVFLDRDGVICHNRQDHVKSWSDFEFLPHAREGLVRLAMLDMPIVVVTNQAAVNRGMVLAETVEEIHRRMVAKIEMEGGRIDRVYYCPHRPEERCDCRKPRPGLLKRAATELGIELKGSYLIGDAWTDIQAGFAVDCRSYLLLTGRGRDQVHKVVGEALGHFQIANNLAQAAAAILQREAYALYRTARDRPPMRAGGALSLRSDQPLPALGGSILKGSND